jgi:hypothetical protein
MEEPELPPSEHARLDRAIRIAEEVNRLTDEELISTIDELGIWDRLADLLGMNLVREELQSVITYTRYAMEDGSFDPAAERTMLMDAQKFFRGEE